MSAQSDPDHPVQKPPRSRSTCRAWTAACLLLMLLGLWAGLPWLAQQAVRQVGQGLGLPELRLHIRNLGPWGLDLGAVSLGPDAGLHVQAVHIDFSPTGLIRGRVDGVRVMGLEIRLTSTDSGWTIQGLPLPETSGHNATGQPFLPVVDHFHAAGHLVLTDDARDRTFPFTVEGSLDQVGRLLGNARLHLAGQELRLELNADLTTGALAASLDLPPSSLAALASLLPGLDLPLAGQVRAMADLLRPESGQPARAQARFGLDAAQTTVGGLLLAQNGSLDADLTWDHNLSLTLSPLQLHAPLPLTLQIENATVDLDARQAALAWAISLDAPPGLISPPLRLSGQTRLHQEGRGWTVRTRAALDALNLQPTAQPTLRLEMAASTLALDLDATEQDVAINATLALGRLRLTRAAIGATLDGLTANATATLREGSLRGSAALSAARLDASQAGTMLASTGISSEINFNLGQQTALNATISTALQARSGDLAGAISLRLPLAWPEPATASGSLDLDLRRQNKGLAKISTRLAQNLRGLEIGGSLNILPVAVRGAVSGQLDLLQPTKTWVEIKTGQEITLPGNLKDISPALGALTGQGRLDATARLHLEQGVPQMPLSLRLRDLRIHHAQTKTVLTGLALSLNFNDLLTTRSAPDQPLRFDRLQLGGVILDNGDIRYQVEGPHSVLVEGCTVHWAGGQIGTHAFRLNPAVEDYVLTLYCDRVELAQALGQLGMSQAQGGGTANGRIPVRYHKGSLTFDNGFLYSTPGQKGVLCIAGTEILTAGVPPGTPQYAQLDLASEALKDFAYEWAKISMNTQGKELVVALELDGKPAKPLPFTYNRDIGGFARIEANSPGSVFQGIRLDVNFRLPLDQLLQYRQLLDLINK